MDKTIEAGRLINFSSQWVGQCTVSTHIHRITEIKLVHEVNSGINYNYKMIGAKRTHCKSTIKKKPQFFPINFSQRSVVLEIFN